MPRYAVTLWLGTKTVEVEADDAEAAWHAMLEQTPVAEILATATYEVREVEA